MTEAPKLKPCPFCGGEAVDDRGGDVHCANGECFAFYKTRHVRAGEWNTRADDHAALREAADKLAEACRKWIEYDEAEEANSVMMMVLYADALDATNAALAAHKEATE